jgi:predicted esterase
MEPRVFWPGVSSPMKTLLISAQTHGRILIEDAAVSSCRGAIVGFHGYGQTAEIMLDELRRLPGSEAWQLVSIQALHPFYTRNYESVVASWMTRQDREPAIVDNIAYVNKAVAESVPGGMDVVFLGFSQGASMAARAATRGVRPAAGLVLLGGDIPPDVRDAAEADWPPVLIACGDKDTWYRERVDSDLAFLEARGVPHEVVRFAGGHEFTGEFRAAVGGWLGSSLRP